MRKRTGVALVAAGLVAGLVLGSIGIAAAATASKASTATAGWSGGLGGPGGGGPDGGRGGRGLGMGPGGLANTVADLTGINEDDVLTQRAAGKSYEAIAKTKGVSADEIVAKALKDAETMMDAAVKVGRMTAAQEKQLLADLKTRLEAEVSSTDALPGPGMRAGRGGGMRGAGGLASTVASLTGMSVDDVMTERQSGKSFAQIAKSKGVGSDTVINKALATATSALKSHFEAEIDETGTAGPGFGPGGGPGFGGGRGPGGRGGFGGGPGGF